MIAPQKKTAQQVVQSEQQSHVPLDHVPGSCPFHTAGSFTSGSDSLARVENQDIRRGYARGDAGGALLLVAKEGLASARDPPDDGLKKEGAASLAGGARSRCTWRPRKIPACFAPWPRPMGMAASSGTR